VKEWNAPLIDYWQEREVEDDAESEEEEEGGEFPAELMSEHKICSHSLMTLCGLGKGVWAHIKFFASVGNAVPNHSLSRKVANWHLAGKAEVQRDDLCAHFDELKELSEVRATQFV
jgi:hypothetical protein